MIGEGILRVIGDIIVNETDALVLVCLLSFLHFSILVFILYLAIEN